MKLISCEGEGLKSRVATNFLDTVRSLLKRRDVAVNTPVDVKTLICETVARANKGLVTKGHGFWRQWESKVPAHPHPDNIESEMEKFYREFLEKHNDPKIDPIDFAAWIEKRFNAEIHPLADGCGRTSKALAAFVLVAAGLPYPEFPSREAYFENIGRSLPQWTAYYRSLIGPSRR